MLVPKSYYYYQGKRLLITPDAKTTSVYFKSGDVPSYFDDKISKFLVSFSPREKLAIFRLSQVKIRLFFADKREDLVIHPVFKYHLDRYTGYSPLVFNNRYFVKFAPQISYQDALQFCEKYDTRVIQRFEGVSNLYLLEYRNLDISFLQTVNEVYEKNKELVLYAHPDFVNGVRNEAPDPLFDLQKPVLNQLRVMETWTSLIGKQLSEIKVAVIDEGIQRTHTDLAGAMWPQSFDSYAGEALPFDDTNFHGTALAGIIGGVHDNGVFVRGVAPNSKLMDVRISITFEGVRESSNANVVNGIQAAINLGAKVINISWSHPFSSSIEDKINEAINTHKIVVCCAAGNFYTAGESKNVIFPAVLAGKANSAVIAVAACNVTELGDLVAPVVPVELNQGFGFGSRRGPEVTVMAPGYSIVTLKMNPPSMLDFKGTSAATAFVSGIAALLLGIDKNLMPMEIKNILKNNAGPNTLADTMSASVDAAT